MSEEFQDEERKEEGTVSEAAASAVKQLVHARKIIRLYPATNPQVEGAVASLRRELAGFPPEEPFHFVIECEQVLYGQIPVLPEEDTVTEFAHALYLANIGAVEFDPEVTAEDLNIFFSLVNVSEQERLDLGRLDDAMQARGVTTIRVKVSGEVKVQEAGDPDSHPWDIVSLSELENLEQKLLKEADRTSFTDTLRTVNEDQDLRATRILGLLEVPEEFSSFLLQLSSRKKVKHANDISGQLEFLTKLIEQLEPFFSELYDADQIRLYEKLNKVVKMTEKSIDRELFSARVPPFVRLGTIVPLFEERLPGITVSEALSPGLRLSLGIAPVLMGGLRCLASDDLFSLSSFLDVQDAPPPTPDETVIANYRLVVEPPAPAVPLQRKQEFFLPDRGDHDFGEKALAAMAARSIGTFDSIHTLNDLLLMEENPTAYQKLLELLVDRFVYCLDRKNIELSTRILTFLHSLRRRHGSDKNLLPLVETALTQCGESEAMQAYIVMLSSCEKKSQEYFKTADLLKDLKENAVKSLMEILAEESDRSRRHRILDILVRVGHGHLDLLTSYRTHHKWYVVRNLLWILGPLGPIALPRIIAVGVHKEARVRRETVRAFGLIGGKEAVKRLLIYLKDKNESVVREAIRQLAKLRARECLPALHGLLKTPELQSREANTAIIISQALGTMGDKESIVLLQSLRQERKGRGLLYTADVLEAFQHSADAIQQRIAKEQA